MSRKAILKEFKAGARALALLLCLSVVLSYGARYHWFLDLFSHFVYQYMVGAAILGFSLWAFGERRFAALMGIVFVVCLVETRIPTFYNPVKQTGEAQRLITLVQYNRLFIRQEHEDLRQWLAEHSDSFDVVVLQEANASLSETAKTLVDAYPHQIHEPQTGAFGMVVLSRHPFMKSEKIFIHGPFMRNFIQRIVIAPGSGPPVTIYAMHALPPQGSENVAQWKYELTQAANVVGKDESTNIIFMGDWNITPFSPHFTDLLKSSGLTYQIDGPFHMPTWPSSFITPLMQIPIDHVLSSPEMSLRAMRRDSALGSDHYPVIATFSY